MGGARDPFWGGETPFATVCIGIYRGWRKCIRHELLVISSSWAQNRHLPFLLSPPMHGVSRGVPSDGIIRLDVRTAPFLRSAPAAHRTNIVSAQAMLDCLDPE